MTYFYISTQGASPCASTGFAQTVSCAADPLDMRPALDALEGMIHDQMTNGPLFVLMAESHKAPALKMFRQAIMARLMKSASAAALLSNGDNRPLLAYGTEDPYNMLEVGAEKILGVILPPYLKGSLAAADIDGRRLSQIWHRNTPHDAPVSSLNLKEFCRRASLSTRPNDTARTGLDIDMADPALLGACRGSGQLSAISGPGMAVRNKMIFERATAHQRQSGARVYIQECGRNHLFGNEKFPFAHSLAAHFSDAGKNALYVYATETSADMARIPADAFDVLPRSLLINDLSMQRSALGEAPNEKTFMEDVRKHSGQEPEIFTAIGPGLSTEELRGQFVEWCEQTLTGPVMVQGAPKWCGGQPSAAFS